MNTRKDKKFAELIIKRTVLDSPSEGFTNAVMEQLSVDVEKELYLNGPFAHFPEREGIESPPSHDFTDTIIFAIDSSGPAPKNVPIITKRTGYIFTLGMLSLTWLSFYIKEDTGVPEDTKRYTLNFLFEFIHSSSINFTTIFVCIFSASLLLIIDFVFKNKYA